MATPPTFSAGSVLTAAQMNAVGLWDVTPSAVSGTGVSYSKNVVTLSASPEPYITCFSSDFAHYRLICDLTAHGGAAQSLTFRMANGTTPNTTAGNYYYVLQEQPYSGGGLVTAGSAGAAAIFACGRVSGNFGAFTMDILNPYSSTQRTTYSTSYQDNEVAGRTGGALTVTTSYNAFNLRLNGTNTMTGTIRIYGYN